MSDLVSNLQSHPFFLIQIDTSHCGTTRNCFMRPTGCTNTTCDILITYQYNNNTNAIDVELSTKNKWVAFGLNTARSKMVRSISLLFCNFSVAVTTQKIAYL